MANLLSKSYSKIKLMHCIYFNKIDEYKNKTDFKKVIVFVNNGELCAI